MKFQRPSILTYQETIRFHGHNGPFLALGYKLGKYINEKHKLKSIMDIIIKVKVKPEKPFTCIIDGLQCSTFTTLGKGNIGISKWKSSSIEVIVEKGKRKHRYRITEHAFNMCFGQDDLVRAARRVFNTPARLLWVVVK